MLESAVKLVVYLLGAKLAFAIIRTAYRQVFIAGPRTKKVAQLVRELREKISATNIPLAKDIPKNAKEEILRMSALQLAKAILERKYTSEQVVSVVCEAALHSHQNYNCLCEVRFDEAIKEAKEADRILRETNTPIGILHGVPFSVKEHIRVKDLRCTCGIQQKFMNGPSVEDAFVIGQLRKAGAIPIATTNVPQFLMAMETLNHIYGETCNPHDKSRTCGGSTGGEGALIASFGSPLGLGSDVGGSIRIPSALCGIVGFKPTPHRVSDIGIEAPGATPQNSIISTIGPMSRSVDDCVAVSKIFFNTSSSDTSIPPVPFNEALFSSNKPLKIGYYTSDGFFDAAKCYERAVTSTVEKLKSLGHTVIPFRPYDIDSALFGWTATCFADGFEAYIESSQYEAFLDMYKLNRIGTFLPGWGRDWIIMPLIKLLGQQKIAGLLKYVRARTLNSYLGLVRQRVDYSRKFFALWNELELDAVICPPIGLPAPPRGMTGKVTPNIVSYTSLINYLNATAGIVPVSHVQPDECFYESSPSLRGELAAHFAKQAMQNTAGLPVCVQVYSKPYHDEVVLRLMKEIEENVPYTSTLQPIIST